MLHSVNCFGRIIATKYHPVKRWMLENERLFTSKTGNRQQKIKSQDSLKKYYQTLGVPEDCEDETLRLAFVRLAKQFHPDGRSSNADATRFSEIENAYRKIQRERSIQCERDARGLPPGVEEFDIKHTAPQHRHFLQYDTGTGTPSERQRRHTTERAQEAAENVMEHRLKKIQAAERNSLIGMDKSRAKDVKTRYGIDRLVEDLIQEAMNKGEFSDLPGAGKPLADNSSSQNPYIDFVTHKMNKVLMDNGFTPEWIQLSKDIRLETRSIEEELSEVRQKLGPTPLTIEDEHTWNEKIKQLNDRVKRMNSQIDKYNLLVPILQMQMLRVDLKILAERALEKPPTIVRNDDDKRINIKQRKDATISDNQSSSIGSFFLVLADLLTKPKNK